MYADDRLGALLLLLLLLLSLSSTPLVAVRGPPLSSVPSAAPIPGLFTAATTKI